MGSRKFLLLGITVICFIIPNAGSSVHYLEEWGIYELDPVDGTVTPIFTIPDEIITVRLDPSGEIMASP